MFKLDLQGKCGSCLLKANEADIIRCTVCEFSFHGVCKSADGRTDGIATQTHLGLYKKASTKPNFSWKCDQCLTISEHTQAASVKDIIVQLMDRFTKFENELPGKIKTLVSDEFLKRDQIDELSTNIVEKMAHPVIGPVTPWNDKPRVENIKSGLIIKPDKDGNPVDDELVSNIVVANGVPVNKVVVSDTGETYISLPNTDSRDKLSPLLQSVTNDVVNLKAKSPTLSIYDVKENLTKDQIKQALCNQNDYIGKLVNEDHEYLEVVYTRPPPTGKHYHKVSVRVSPLLRKCIRNRGDKVFLCKRFCRVDDSYHVRRCNRCQGFKHYADKCEEERKHPVACGFCAENHKSNECPIKESESVAHTCINCRKAGLESKGHATFSMNCPAYKIEQDKLKSSIACLN